MVNRKLIACLVVIGLAVLAALWLMPGHSRLGPSAAATGGNPGPPPLAGSVQNFTPFDSPRPAPEIAMTDGTGAPVKLAALAGKPVILNLWATWCAPCVREMASLDRLQAVLGAKAQVIALSQDKEGKSVVAPFFQSKGISHLATYLDPPGAAARALNIDGLPTTFILDAQGRIVGEMVGPAEWDSPEALALVRHYLPPG